MSSSVTTLILSIVQVSKGPQLWEVNVVDQTARLSFGRTYMRNDRAEFAGTTSFWGDEDELVLCAVKSTHVDCFLLIVVNSLSEPPFSFYFIIIVGTIYIWDRQSAQLLRRIEDIGPFTCISWNPVKICDWIHFATGNPTDGVKLWKHRVPQPTPEV
jgi:hypothetical protein